MSKWGPKLEKKLNGLADSASKESIQTLANWIGFNRKHAPIISKTLTNALTTSTTTMTRQWLYWQVVHELLLLDHTDTSKWEKLMDLRTLLGEGTVVPAIELLLGSSNVSPQVEPLVKQWDDRNVFGGPTIVLQIRKLLTMAKSNSTTTTNDNDNEEEAKTNEAAPSASASSPAKDKEASPKATTTSTTTATAPEAAPTPKETTTTEEDLFKKPPQEHTPLTRRVSLSNMKEVEYDFESKNVPQGKVESREFLDPCKAIATLQIARDLRNDSAVQLSSLLSNLAGDILETCQKGPPTDDNTNEDLDAATIRDYSIRIPAQLLDMDLDEQIHTIRTFREIVIQQQAARRQLIHLLLKSRCQFGSHEAAHDYLELKETSQKLKRRRQLLSDALELEGLDNEEMIDDTTDFESALHDLPEMTWYNKDKEDNPTTTTTAITDNGDDDNKDNKDDKVSDEQEQASASKKARID